MAKRARSTRPPDCPYVTKGGLKLAFALERFPLDVRGCVAADLGCHRGGFTDCLLQRGAARVYAVDTAYGTLDWKLRNDARVSVHERTNLIHWTSPEPLDLAVIDAGWTRLHLAAETAQRSVKPTGLILGLLKPQYEAEESERVRGVLAPDRLPEIVSRVRNRLGKGVVVKDEAVSPFPGSGGNTEVWLLMTPGAAAVGTLQ